MDGGRDPVVVVIVLLKALDCIASIHYLDH